LRNTKRETPPPMFSVALALQKRKSCVIQKKRTWKNWERQQVRKPWQRQGEGKKQVQ